MLVILLWAIVTSLARSAVGLDIVAGLSMAVAIAFGETLAVALVALMYAGGQLLEDFAANRARADMRALLARLPKTALRYDDGHLHEVPIDAARHGVQMKGGPVLEAMARAQRLLIEKTGTLTHGRPEPVDIVAAGRRRPSHAWTLCKAIPRVRSSRR